MDRTIFQVERHVVLVEPEVHWNTGNIGRTCLGAGALLHLIKPLGFSLTDKAVRRAGLDYWSRVRLKVWETFDEFLETMAPRPEEVLLFAKYGSRSFRDMPSGPRLFLVFGSETRGLAESVLNRYSQNVFHIPITRDIRCLNLSTAVGIALYESLRDGTQGHQWHCEDLDHG